MPKPLIDINELHKIIEAFFQVAETIPQSTQSIQLLAEAKSTLNTAYANNDYTGLQLAYRDLGEQVRLFGLVYQLVYLTKIKQITTHPGLYTKLEEKLNKTATRLQKRKHLPAKNQNLYRPGRVKCIYVNKPVCYYPLRAVLVIKPAGCFAGCF